MALNKRDKEWALESIMIQQAWRGQLDKTLLGFLERVKLRGKKVRASKFDALTLTEFVTLMTADKENRFQAGFRDPPKRELVKNWLQSELLVLQKKGAYADEVAGVKPLFINAYKLRHRKFADDKRQGEQLYHALHVGRPGILENVREVFAEGLDAHTDKFEKSATVDIHTRAIALLCDEAEKDIEDRNASTEGIPAAVPGMWRVLGNDVTRLLAYKDVMPREVLVDQFRTLAGLHLGLYTLKVFTVLPHLVETGEHHECTDCLDETPCPLTLPLVIDLSDESGTEMARMSERSYAEIETALHRYIPAHIRVKKLHQLAETLHKAGKLDSVPTALKEILKIPRRAGAQDTSVHFKALLLTIVEDDADEEVKQILEAEKDPLEQYLKLVDYEIRDYQLKQHRDLLDATLQKNTPSGLMVQPKAGKRRFNMGSQLIETLANVWTIKATSKGKLAASPIRLDEFLSILERTYGIYIQRPPPNWRCTIAQHEAFATNLELFKSRLREIGYFTDLSDAYTAQSIRPRYTLGD